MGRGASLSKANCLLDKREMFQVFFYKIFCVIMLTRHCHTDKVIDAGYISSTFCDLEPTLPDILAGLGCTIELSNLKDQKQVLGNFSNTCFPMFGSSLKKWVLNLILQHLLCSIVFSGLDICRPLHIAFELYIQHFAGYSKW